MDRNHKTLFAAATIALAVLACNAPGAVSPSSLPTDTVQAQPGATPQPSATRLSSPTPSEPQGKIAFTCQIFGEVGRNQICLMDADGSNARRLTSSDFDDHLYASIAPEGNSVLFSSNMSGDYDIYELPLEGVPVRLTSFGDAYAPAASPDGTRIAFTRNDGVNPSIWVMNRDGTASHMVASQAWDPAWSPDGTELLCASDRSGETYLYVVGLDGTGMRVVLEIEGLRGRNDWSPAGEWLATYAGEPWNREIVLFEPSGEVQLQLTNGGNNLAPTFSPDGGWIAFTSYMDRYREEDGCEIYIMRVDGSDLRRLTNNETCDWQPRWGP